MEEISLKELSIFQSNLSKSLNALMPRAQQLFIGHYPHHLGGSRTVFSQCHWANVLGRETVLKTLAKWLSTGFCSPRTGAWLPTEVHKKYCHDSSEQVHKKILPRSAGSVDGMIIPIKYYRLNRWHDNTHNR